MKRILFGLLLSATTLATTTAQTPEIVKEVDNKLRSLRTDDEMLRKALAIHPDVLVAQAKIRVAEAELAQVRLVITQKIAKMITDMEVQKNQLETHVKLLDQVMKQHQAGNAPHSDLVLAQSKVTELKLGIIRLDSELQGIMGRKQDVNPNDVKLNNLNSAIQFVYREDSQLQYRRAIVGAEFVAFAPGSPMEKLKAILDKKITYSATNKIAPDVINEIKEKAGLDIMLRMYGFKNWKEHILAVSVSGELTFPVWIDLVLDEVNSKMVDEKDVFEAYIRDYGILITPRSKSPNDAITLREFARQVRAEKVQAEPKK